MKHLKILGCLLAMFMAAVILFPATAKAADVEINADNFPDAKFREYVKQFDKNDDGKLSKAELEDVSAIEVPRMGISNMKGLEYFTELWYLDCTGNNIATLDICTIPHLVLAYMEPCYNVYDDPSDEYYSYIYLTVPEDWDDDDCDPDPDGTYQMDIDSSTKVIISKPVVPEKVYDQKAGLGKQAKLWVNAYGDGTLSYQWYYKKPGADSWTAVSAAAGKKAVYTFTAAERHNGYKYRCKVTNSNGYAYSNEAQLTVVPKPKITTQPKDVMVKGSGTKATVKVVASGEKLKYTWYVSDPGDNGKFFKSSVKKSSYSATLTKEKNGRKAYVVVTDEYGNSVTSKTVTMSFVTAKPKITSPTKATTKKVAKGKTATFTVKTAVLEKAGKTFQWQYRTSSTGTWKNVSAASGKTASYKLTVAKKHNGYQYRCKVTNPYGTTISKIFTLKVTS